MTQENTIISYINNDGDPFKHWFEATYTAWKKDRQIMWTQYFEEKLGLYGARHYFDPELKSNTLVFAAEGEMIRFALEWS